MPSSCYSPTLASSNPIDRIHHSSVIYVWMYIFFNRKIMISTELFFASIILCSMLKYQSIIEVQAINLQKLFCASSCGDIQMISYHFRLKGDLPRLRRSSLWTFLWEQQNHPGFPFKKILCQDHFLQWAFNPCHWYQFFRWKLHPAIWICKDSEGVQQRFSL